MKKLKAIISKITDHGQGVYSLSIAPEGRVPHFKAGQFLHLAIDDYDPAGGFWPESRVFSICSAPGDDELVVLYSVKGAFTKRMEKHLVVGSVVWVKLPFGDFVIDPEFNSSLVLVAGGTGISPFISFLHGLGLHKKSDCKVSVFYGVRWAEQLIFSDLINELTKANPLVTSSIYVEENSGPENIQGKISDRDVVVAAKETQNTQTYLSGPPAMIQFFKKNLLEHGILSGQIHIDEWE